MLEGLIFLISPEKIELRAKSYVVNSRYLKFEVHLIQLLSQITEN